MLELVNERISPLIANVNDARIHGVEKIAAKPYFEPMNKSIFPKLFQIILPSPYIGENSH